MNNANANAAFFFVVVVVLVIVVALVAIVGIALLFVVILKANTKRSSVAIGSAAEDWAADQGYVLLSSEQVDKFGRHPFRDRFGGGLRRRKANSFGAVVVRIEVEDRQRRERTGWLYIPLKGKSGLHVGGSIPVFADWQNAEVVWDRS